MLLRDTAGDQLLDDVGADQRGVAFERIAPAATAAGAHDHFGIDRHRIMDRVHGAVIVLARQPQQKIAGRAGFAVPKAPRRTLLASRVIEIPAALDQIAPAGLDAEAAAMLAGTAGIDAQRPAFHHHRAFQLDAFDRGIAHVALANRNRAGLAVFRRSPAPTAALDALDDETAFCLRMDAEKDHGAAEKPVMPGRYAVAHRAAESLDDGIDHGRHDQAPARHRRWKPRHHDVALGDDHVERAERTLVDW